MAKRKNPDVPETEDELISRAQIAVSRCNWVVGECASKWTVKYASGRTDADFGRLVGLSGDQIYQRRRVWETFGDVYEEYASLKWSHFYAALNWDDAPECLQWAEENETTVAEMKAWRRAIRGEDLDEPPLDAFGGDPAVTFMPTEPQPVREPGAFGASGESRNSSGGRREPAETVAGVARDSGSAEGEYAPFRQGAGNPAPEVREEPAAKSAVATPPRPSAEQLLKRMTTTLERMNKSLTPETVHELHEVPAKLRNRFFKALSELNSKTAELM